MDDVGDLAIKLLLIPLVLVDCILFSEGSSTGEPILGVDEVEDGVTAGIGSDRECE